MIIDYMLVNVGVRLSETLIVQTHLHFVLMILNLIDFWFGTLA